MPKHSPIPFLVSVLGLMLMYTITTVYITSQKNQQARAVEPLADPTSLVLLAQGKLLPEPPDNGRAVFHGSAVVPPTIANLNTSSRVLGLSTLPVPDDSKRIEVDLTHQKVYAYEGNTKVYDFTVSTGKWGRTPTGEFRIWTKVKSQLMKGGDPALHTYYYLPNVPWVMFFYNNTVAKMRGFSFHGTYWHSNFGHPMSHGCINMQTDEAKILYDWASPVVTNPKAWSTPTTTENPGTRVVIYGETPTS
jgi:lipoprotein-anchoring transpeptidase ErfK/SrfK